MKHSFECPHGITETLIGSDHGCYCNQCKSEIFSKELYKKLEQNIIPNIITSGKKIISKEYLGELIDMSLNYDKQQ